MKTNKLIFFGIIAFIILFSAGCQMLKIPKKKSELKIPDNYYSTSDSDNAAMIPWRKFFTDSTLIALIDTAIKNNREVNIVKEELAIARNEIKAKKGDYLPFAGIAANTATDRSGSFTFNGISEEDIKADPEKYPRYVGDFNLNIYASWEVDVWKKLRNSKKAAVERFFATEAGRNFMITNLVAEVACSYYELLALDNQLGIIEQNIEVQQNAARLVKEQKEAARLSQLAVNRFEAQLLNTMSLQYKIKQQIVETQNSICFLVGHFSSYVKRENRINNQALPEVIKLGNPIQLLSNRPDIIQAAYQVKASNLDIEIAKAAFYPSIRLSANIGIQAFNPSVLFNPSSVFYGLLGDLITPIVNQNSLRAYFKSSHSKQIQSINNYEQVIIKAYNEVQNQKSALDNFSKCYEIKKNEVDILTKSVGISDNLFKNARADYIEVLLTQKEALDSKIELNEIFLNWQKAKIGLYKSLGGGWR